MIKRLASRLEALLEDGSPDEPFYDPVHLAGVLLGTLAAVGALFWLLWTLLVFEGGLWPKVRAAAEILLTSKTPADFGYRGPHDRGVFEGWLGNAAALVLTAAALGMLRGLYAHLRRGAGARRNG